MPSDYKKSGAKALETSSSPGSSPCLPKQPFLALGIDELYSDVQYVAGVQWEKRKSIPPLTAKV